MDRSVQRPLDRSPLRLQLASRSLRPPLRRPSAALASENTRVFPGRKRPCSELVRRDNLPKQLGRASQTMASPTFFNRSSSDFGSTVCSGKMVAGWRRRVRSSICSRASVRLPSARTRRQDPGDDAPIQRPRGPGSRRDRRRARGCGSQMTFDRPSATSRTSSGTWRHVRNSQPRDVPGARTHSSSAQYATLCELASALYRHDSRLGSGARSSFDFSLVDKTHQRT